MTRSVCMIALTLSTLFGCSFAARIQRRGSSLLDDLSMGDCGEPNIEGICKCGHWSVSNLFSGAFQCSECVDPTKWGYGCTLSCPESCPNKCDFSGNCIPDDPCPAHCKRNSRVADKTDKSLCVNALGLCQACVEGFYGQMCENSCPSGCADSVEGGCKRDGSCYSCKKGFYGPRCEDECPDACPKCMMTAGLNDEGDELPAGSCAQSCKGDLFGRECKDPCSTNCDRTEIKKGKASCSRTDGACKKCAVGFFGAKCGEECNAGCAGKECRQDTGVCVNGCETGFWGPKCDKDCPEFSESQGCDRDDGFPKTCDANHFPSRKDEVGVCAECPTNCLDNECDDKGHCTKGCDTGYYGKTCSDGCPDGCDEALGCGMDTGYCKQCKPGLTGVKCSKSCHSQCATCKQSTSGILGATPANTAEDCLTCPGDDAAEMSDTDGTCQCIPGAERADSTSKCECKQPADPLWESVFETNPKKCASRCKGDHDGVELRPVSGLGTTKCIALPLYNAVAAMWSKWYSGPMPEKGGGGCGTDEYKIEDDDRSTCLHREFVIHIAGKDNVEKKDA